MNTVTERQSLEVIMNRLRLEPNSTAADRKITQAILCGVRHENGTPVSFLEAINLLSPASKAAIASQLISQL
jgi:hypothetical protein